MDIIIETPKGSRQKYKWDETFRLLRLSKTLAAGLVFPYDFGFFPGTKGQDGDPLDVIVLSEFTTFPGCLIDARVIGCIQVLQKKGKQKIRNDRFVAIAEQSLQFEGVTTFNELPLQVVTEMEAFFKNYLQAEGKEPELPGNLDAMQAMLLLLHS